jgi:NADH:ubiquinone oxidoreductase subunit F (NADH-binding)
MSSDRLLAGIHPDRALGLDRHLAVHGGLPRLGHDLIAEVEAAGLLGRGGAGFPAAVKLAAVAQRTRPVVVVNGTEGEPMSAKDRVLLHHAPHLVLDGAQAAAAAVGAREVLVAAPEHKLPGLAAALAERRGGPRFTLAPRASGYVAGEETAVLAHLEGRPALPRVSPPRPAERGYRGRPTLVQNVETLCHLALIARHGARWFREQGTADRPGTTLVTVSGAVDAPGVYEVPSGMALDELTRFAAPTEPVRAMLVGGYFGAWIRGDGAGLKLEDASLRRRGAAVGAGIVVVLGESACPVAETARLARYLAGQSAGQCGPCVHGLGALADVVSRFAAGRTATGDAQRLVRWIEMVRRRGACAHPDGVARMLASACEAFRDELEDHAQRGPCARCATPSALMLSSDRPLRSAA